MYRLTSSCRKRAEFRLDTGASFNSVYMEFFD